MDIFVINIDSSKSVSKELLEEFNYKNYSDIKKRSAHSFAYLMTDRILKEVYKIQNREIVFDNNTPYLKSGEKYFSISHSGNYILIGFSDSTCGADIELIKERNYKKISKRMKFNTKSLEDFYQSWTEYEAIYKLGNEIKKYSKYNCKFDNYMIAAACSDINEKFELYASFE